VETPIQNPSLKSVERSYRRIDSIDFVRGLAIVVMALDHTRDFMCNIPFEPEDISKTWMFYFLVRWVTHFCAPAFFLLAGVGAYLYGQKHSRAELTKFLVTRGIWLVVLEFTVIGFAWTFHPGWGMFGVICCLVVDDSSGGIRAFAALRGHGGGYHRHCDARLVRRLEAGRSPRRPMAVVCAASLGASAYRGGFAFRLVPADSVVRRDAAWLQYGLTV